MITKPEIIMQYGDVYSDPPERIRPASRALIIKDGKILLIHETNTDVYMSPGGGVESNETFKECCIRELKEEAGYAVETDEELFTVNEYSFETLYIAHYFPCRIIGEATKSLTKTEIEHGVHAEWVDIDKAFEIFGKYNEKRPDIKSLYLREYTVLSKYLK